MSGCVYTRINEDILFVAYGSSLIFITTENFGLNKQHISPFLCWQTLVAASAFGVTLDNSDMHILLFIFLLSSF